MGAMAEHFGNALPEMVVEPGRFIVGDAGVVSAEVVLVSRKAKDDRCAGSTSTSAASAAGGDGGRGDQVRLPHARMTARGGAR
jgi:hypothetical protein